MSHFIVKCKSCDATITQCRCFDKNKTVRYDLCDVCKIKIIETANISPITWSDYDI